MKHRAADHPKMADLMARLKVPKYAAVGLLEMLWHFTSEYAPQGDVGRWSDEAIAKGCGWGGDPQRLVGAWVGAGWVDPHPDHRLVVHDWKDHIQEATKKKLLRSGLYVIDVQTSAENGRQNFPRACAVPLPLPKPLPLPLPSASPPAAEKPKALGMAANGKSKFTDLLREDSRSPFVEACAAGEIGGSETDWREAWFEWDRLDFEQQAAAVAGIQERIRGSPDDPALKALPQNYLKKRMWQRPMRQPAKAAKEDPWDKV